MINELRFKLKEIRMPSKNIAQLISKANGI